MRNANRHGCFDTIDDNMVSRGDILDLNIESSAYKGKMVAHHNGLVVFVPLAVPGDRVRARVVRKRRKFAEAVVEEVLDPSGHRVTPRCPHFGVCGGCTLQNASYEAQLEFKRSQVQDLLERIGNFDRVEVPPVIPSPRRFYYRNKMEFTFGNTRWVTREEIESQKKLDRDFALGLHAPRRYDRIVDLDVCYLQSPETAKILNATRSLAVSQNWEPYDSRKHRGFVRNLVVRTTARTNQILVNLVTTTSDAARMDQFSEALLQAVPNVTTILNSVNDTRSPVAGGQETILYGGGYIQEQLDDYLFRVYATSFFQPNPLQAENLAAVVRDFAQIEGSEKALDLYSGAGAIALSLSSQFSEVLGLENHSASVEAARITTKLNEVNNCRFLEADVNNLDRALPEGWKRPEVIVADPPRSGMHGSVCNALNESVSPKRIIYISCNPATQARDLSLLKKRYRLLRVQPMDMFPQTYHIENVALLEPISI